MFPGLAWLEYNPLCVSMQSCVYFSFMLFFSVLLRLFSKNLISHGNALEYSTEIPSLPTCKCPCHVQNLVPNVRAQNMRVSSYAKVGHPVATKSRHARHHLEKSAVIR